MVQNGKKFLAKAFIFVAKWLEKLHLKLAHWAVQLHLSPDSSTSKLLEQIAKDCLAFQDAPKKAAESLQPGDAELADAVFLYFLTKQTISLYEAQINYLPLQVYNEMRNALDHYMRALITPPQEDSSSQNTAQQRRESHIKKMTAHLQRALLDVIKLTCAAMVEKIDETHGRVGENALSLAMDGDYIKQITQHKMSAEQKLVTAKLIEHNLGNGSESSVRAAYLEALSSHLLAYKYFQDSLGSLHWGRAKYLSLKGSTFALTVAGSALAGYIVRVLWAASEDLPIIKTIIEAVKTVSNHFHN